ncbi:uncharacterized protein LOC143260552 [Megalopta genalis]|uniref:uncharacterized protein LOC143260552 n=1 Tax=Megalopta genalis TaxID=115081 RepID=UPI003FD357A6
MGTHATRQANAIIHAPHRILTKTSKLFNSCQRNQSNLQNSSPPSLNTNPKSINAGYSKAQTWPQLRPDTHPYQLPLQKKKSLSLINLRTLERKLKRDPELNNQYRAIFKEYLDLGHMSEIPDTNEGYYLPHHGVSKMSSQTTKLRMVFDGSAASSTGLSLNDVLHTDLKNQDELLYILLRFRTHQYVITGDIEKIYRQFLIRPEDRKYQQIFWRDHNDNIKTYQLNTVTFGLSAAPYLAIRCLTQLAEDEHHRRSDNGNSATIQEAISLRKDLITLLNTAGLHVRQWASYDKRLLEDLSDENINQQLHLGESSIIKTLEIVWNSADDSITYTVRPILHTPGAAKRFISSEIAKIYDPLGLLGLGLGL